MCEAYCSSAGIVMSEPPWDTVRSSWSPAVVAWMVTAGNAPDTAMAGRTPRLLFVGAALLLVRVPTTAVLPDEPVMLTFSEDPVAVSAVLPANSSALTPRTWPVAGVPQAVMAFGVREFVPSERFVNSGFAVLIAAVPW